jgi:hypothetical protein
MASPRSRWIVTWDRRHPNRETVVSGPELISDSMIQKLQSGAGYAFRIRQATGRQETLWRGRCTSPTCRSIIDEFGTTPILIECFHKGEWTPVASNA